MSCVGSRNCGKALTLTLESHGIRFGFCNDHLGEADKLVKSSSAAGKTSVAAQLTSADHVHDYTRLCAVLLCQPLFMAAMRKFTTEASRAIKAERGIWRINKSKIDLPLSRVLSAYEGLCWFNVQKKIMSGLLTADEFWGAIKNGYMVKDPGPGPDHGEFSHRLQWHYIMRVVTDGFTVAKTGDWKLSPLQMYCGMGDQGRTRNIWGGILEGNGIFQATPGAPDWVNRQFKTDGALGDTSFGQTIQKRFDKREALLNFVIQELTKAAGPQKLFTVHTLATQPPKGASVNAHAVIEFLYKWKKSGPPTWVATPSGAPSGASKTEQLAGELWNGGLDEKWKGGKTGYEPAKYPDGGISEGLLLHQSEAVIEDASGDLNSRLSTSRASLNTAMYRYSTKVGASLRS